MAAAGGARRSGRAAVRRRLEPVIKQTMQRKKPLQQGYYGYSTFSELLEDAERKNIIKLKKDQCSGTYVVTGFAKP